MYFCSLLNGINGSVKPNLLQSVNANDVTYGKNELIELPKNKMGIVVRGVVYITNTDEDGRRTISEILFENDLIGSDMLVSYETYIVSKSKTQILFFDMDKVFETQNKRLCDNLHSLLISASNRRLERINILSKKTTEKKLSFYFTALSKKQKNKKTVVPISYSDLADFLCVDRASMMREISKMQRNGRICVHKKEVELLY
ncbi:MAG: hypothetical protein DBY14_00505 [Escherichia coli]|nr:MAG: hypothetical protein DBY14_00505 [Escherichia coli]